MAGSQKRAIHEPEGRDESRFALICKNSERNLNVTIVKYILSLLGQTLSLLGQTNCPGLLTLCPKRLLVNYLTINQQVGHEARENHKVKGRRQVLSESGQAF